MSADGEVRGNTMKYAVVIEKANRNYSVFVPDLPGCVATGKTPDDALQQISEAIVFHLEGMRMAGLPIPEPSVRTDYVEV